MDHRRFHLLEKIQVQLTAAAALLVVYFALWPALRPAEPEHPLTFIPAGGYAGAAIFACTVWFLAGACALLTVSARPESALVAALIGAAGVSARSPQIRTLLWQHEGDLQALYGELILEVVVLCAVLLVAAGIVDFLRGLVGRLKPNWIWKPPIASSEKSGPASDQAEQRGASAPGGSAPAGLVLYLLRPWRAGRPARRSGSRPGGSGALKQSIACLILGLLIALALLALLMRSADRGQIIFALLCAFIIASIIAHQVYPTPHSIFLWGMPLLVAVGFYALGAFSAGRGEGAWIKLMHLARALPVDWLTAGCGGALIGYWVSERLHELRHIERAERSG